MMANSSTVTAGDDATAAQYNNLRKDVLDTTDGHTHNGTDSMLLAWGFMASAAQVWVDTWNNTTSVTFTDDDLLWDDDTQSKTITLRRKSDVVIIGDVAWANATGRTNNWEMRWKFDGTEGQETGNIGNTAATVEHHIVLGKFSGVASGDRTLLLQVHKTQEAQKTDDVTVYIRNVVALIIPVD